MRKPKAKRNGRRRRAAKMPAACARQFLRFATELDRHAQRLDMLETVMVIVAGKAGAPF